MLVTSPERSAILHLLLPLPGAAMLTMFLLHLEPYFGILEPVLAAPEDRPHIVGTLIAVTCILVLPTVALIRSLRVLRSSASLFSLHGLVVAVSLAVLLTFFSALLIDQYPCFIGVPNCD